MIQIRRRVHFMGNGYVPLYHYTQPSVVPMIAKGGLRMSTQGQGDGGVYFSTLGPCSYGFGNSIQGKTGKLDHYEDALIKDCFGVERMGEYQGQNKLSAVIVYAIPAYCLTQAPGGRKNALVVGKADFKDLSLPDFGNFFLAPHFIMGAFLIDPLAPPKHMGPLDGAASMEEAAADRRMRNVIQDALKRAQQNSMDVFNAATHAMALSTDHNLGKLKTVDGDNEDEWNEHEGTRI